MAICMRIHVHERVAICYSALWTPWLCDLEHFVSVQTSNMPNNAVRYNSVALPGTQVVGVVNLTMQKASTDFAEAVACKLGSPYVMITNMAVAQQHRRQGIAQYLMNACLQQGLHSIGRQTVLMALLVYKDNEAACRYACLQSPSVHC